MEFMLAKIITIGDELLTGQTVDSNAAFIATELNKVGIEVIQIISVGDTYPVIEKALDLCSDVDFIFVSGGLGPTSDDKTREAIGKYFKVDLIEDSTILEKLRKQMESRGIAMNQYNVQQALVPAGAILYNNSLGSAPGIEMKKGNATYIFLPGVPFELQAIVNEEVLPAIISGIKADIWHKIILTHGEPESIIAGRLAEFEKQLPEQVSLAYLPSPGMVKLRLTARGIFGNEAMNILQKQVESMHQIISDIIVGYEDHNLETLVGDLLRKMQKTLGLAESCTGGAIASRITTVAGSSEYFKGGIIAYSNEIKAGILGIDPEIIENKGAVSEEVVMLMAKRVLDYLKVDYSIATSGIAGPGGGSLEKPVGTVWIAVASRDRVEARKYFFGNDRVRNIERTVMSGLAMLLKFLQT